MLKDTPASARPREKLLALGPAALADAELIALLLRTGLPGTGVLQLAEDCSPPSAGCPACCTRGREQLGQVKGLGPAKRAEMAAVLELARAARSPASWRRARCSTRRRRSRTTCRCSSPAAEHEVFAVLFLDAQSRLLRLEEMFRGTLTQTSVYPREVVKRALELGAASVILAHNHPSGAAEPSRADEFLTQTLKNALALVDVRVLDHLVVGRGAVVSFAERGLL